MSLAPVQRSGLVSTIAIGLDRPGSDLDILCQHPDPAFLAATLAAQGWQVRNKDEQVWIAEQRRHGPDGQCWPVELYLTPDPLETCHGWRHLSLMAALLERFGAPSTGRCCACALMKGSGEAAMCRLLGLSGDPLRGVADPGGRQPCGALLPFPPHPLDEQGHGLVRPRRDSLTMMPRNSRAPSLSVTFTSAKAGPT